MRATLLTLVLLAALPAGPALGQWQTVDFDLTKNDRAAYTTDLPDSAFGPQGIRIDVDPRRAYTLTSQGEFDGDFNYDVQIDIPQRSEKGAIWVDLVLVNEAKQRKVLATYESNSTEPGTERGSIRYLKDGKAQSRRFENRLADSSSTTGYPKDFMDWLRVHKEGARVWFMQKLRKDPYAWACIANYPRTTYFQEDCETFKVALVIRGGPDAAGTVNVKAMKVSGNAVKPRESGRQVFLFDFGPVTQELEDDFVGVSEFTRYSPKTGYGWIVPEPEKVIYDEEAIPQMSDEEIRRLGFQPIPQAHEGWFIHFLRQSYWMQANDKKLFYASSHGNDYVEFFRQWLDLKTPLERDFVGMARPLHFGADPLYQKDVEERRGSIYIDDDLAAEFAVDLPNGQYNVILGVGFTGSLMAGDAFNVEIEGRVRRQGLGPNWRRPCQFPVRNVQVEDGQMNLRFFCDCRKAMDKYANEKIGIGWMINYLVILPADQRELMNQWEWRIIRRRGEIIRRVTFVKGDPAVVRNEGGFLSHNGKPFYLLKLMNNYVPGDTDHVGYYALANNLSAFQATSGSQHFFKPDWEKLSYSDDYPWDAVDRMNMAYTWGCLTTLHDETILSFVPLAVSGEGTPTADSRGRRNPYNVQPPLNSALGHEIQKEAYTMMSNQFATHPALGGHFIYEELWHPDDLGYDDQSLIQYWEWLRRRYSTVEALNAEWGAGYAAFEDILQPTQGKKEFWQHTPQFVNFRKFRGWAQREMVRSACDLVHAHEPGHFAYGAKGDFGTQSWYPAEFLDMFGWYEPYVAASAARTFGRAALSGGYMLPCEHCYLDGRRQFDHKPGPRRYLGREETAAVYNKVVSSVFKGSKGFFNEWYSDGLQHIFHRTTLIADKGPKFAIKHWTGQIAFFEPEGYEGAPVTLDRGPLFASAANKMLYRLGPLWLPARPLQPRVLVPTTEASFFLDFLSPKPYADFESVTLRLLRSVDLPADFIALTAVKDLSPYKLIIIGDECQSIARPDAERIARWVRAGGKLILVNGGGFSDDARPRRYRPNTGEVYPLEAFSEIGGYTLQAANPWHMPIKQVTVSFVAGDLAPDVADGAVLETRDLTCTYTAKPSSKVFLRGKLQDGKTVDLGLVSGDGNVAVIDFPPKGAKDESVRPLAKVFRNLVLRWGIDDRVTLGGSTDDWDLYAGCLEGDGYWLAAVSNQSPQESRRLNLRLKLLPPGQYAVMDVTGDRPDLEKKADGGWTLKTDPAARASKILHQLSAQEIAEPGIPAEVAAGQASVYLIRPMDEKVWVSIWPPMLKTFVRQNPVIAYGNAAEDKAGAEAVRDALAKVGATAAVMAAAEVRKKKLHHEVRISPDHVNKTYREDTSKWYLVDTFDNEVVDTESPMILVGSQDSNPLVAHLNKDGTFAMDKALEKVSAAYPGPGRGVISTVEAVNFAVYDMRSQARDAVVAGGSDAAGTRAAVDELIRLIDKHCRPEKPGAPAVAGQ
jgi:hypothetical protein